MKEIRIVDQKEVSKIEIFELQIMAFDRPFFVKVEKVNGYVSNIYRIGANTHISIELNQWEEIKDFVKKTFEG